MKKLLYLVNVAFIRELQYRANFFLSIFKLIIPIGINVVFWNAVFSNSTKSIIYGYTYDNMMKYIVCVNLINMIISVNFAYDVATDIHSGQLNNFIIKPISYTSYRMFLHIGSKLLVFVFFIVSCTVFFFITSSGGNNNITILRSLSFIIGLFLAGILNNFIFYCISLSAFWLTQTGYMFWVLQELINILSGAIFPLTIFGNGYVSISHWLPFEYIVHFPTNIFLNKVTSQEIILGITVQVIWIFMLFILSKILWKYGTKKYIAVGG